MDRKYSDLFYTELNELFPTVNLDMHDELLGRLVRDSVPKFSGAQIVEAFDTGQQDQLLAAARQGARFEALAKEWISKNLLGGIDR